MSVDRQHQPDDISYMNIALSEANKALTRGEVPIGACLVLHDHSAFFSASNQTIGDHDITSHAEILCLRQATSFLKNHRLSRSTLYVTLEPCIMCLGALIHARVDKLVIAARDSREHSIHKQVNLYQNHAFNHKFTVEFGCQENQARELLKEFFHARRT